MSLSPELTANLVDLCQRYGIASGGGIKDIYKEYSSNGYSAALKLAEEAYGLELADLRLSGLSDTQRANLVKYFYQRIKAELS